jgi:hypothetical protein
MKLLIGLLIFAGPRAFAGDILFIDLNNSNDEISHCMDGLAADNRAHPKKRKDHVAMVGVGDAVDADAIEDAIKEKEDQGYTFDTIVISGHDGSGHFFGENGSVLASEITQVVADRSAAIEEQNASDGGNRVPLNQSLTGMALWGCYTTTANACENFWMKNVSPNIKATLGFTLQSPDNKKSGNWALLQDYCMNRKKIADAATEQEMNEAFHSLAGINHWNAGICFGDGVCSTDYARVGEAAGSCYHSYQEVYDRCKQFDPKGKQLQMFANYLAAKDHEFADPPPDGENEYTSSGKKPTASKGDLRKFYSQLQLWYACAGELQKETGYEMPSPAQVIRLTKFDTVKRNFENLQKPELDQYNTYLHKMGLDQYALYPSRMSRQEIVAATEGAASELQRQVNKGNKYVNGIDPYKMLVMAWGFDNSLRELEPVCTAFSYVHDDASVHSLCVAPYGRYPKWPKR